MTDEEQMEMFNAYYMADYPSRKASATTKPTYAELEKENAELKERADRADLDSVTFFNQLCKAKEIISELLNSCFGYNSKTVNYEVKTKAEQFLKENA